MTASSSVTFDAARWPLAWLCAAYFAMGTSTLAIVGGLPKIAAGLQVSADAVAQLVGAFAITFALAAPAIQVLLGDWPRRRLLLAGLALLTLGTLASALAPSYGMLFAARIAAALGAAAIGPVASALGASLVSPSRQGGALASVFLGMTLSSVLSVPASASIAMQFGWRPMLEIVALLDATVAIGVTLVVPACAPGQPMRLRDLLSLLAQRSIASATGVVFLQMTGLFVTYTLIVPLLRQHFGLPAALVSVALLVFGIAGVFGNMLARRIALLWTAPRALGVALLTLAATFGVAGFAPPTVALAFGFLVVWAVANDVFMPSQQRRMVELAPQARAMVLALNSSALYIGMSTGSFIGGFTYRHAGLGSLGTASMVLTLFAAGLLWLSVRSSRIAPATTT